jgi:hypothetical protein
MSARMSSAICVVSLGLNAVPPAKVLLNLSQENMIWLLHSLRTKRDDAILKPIMLAGSSESSSSSSSSSN